MKNSKQKKEKKCKHELPIITSEGLWCPHCEKVLDKGKSPKPEKKVRIEEVKLRKGWWTHDGLIVKTIYDIKAKQDEIIKVLNSQ
jgi:hypothetical protein